MILDRLWGFWKFIGWIKRRVSSVFKAMSMVHTQLFLTFGFVCQHCSEYCQSYILLISWFIPRVGKKYDQWMDYMPISWNSCFMRFHTINNLGIITMKESQSFELLACLWVSHPIELNCTPCPECLVISSFIY